MKTNNILNLALAAMAVIPMTGCSDDDASADTGYDMQSSYTYFDVQEGDKSNLLYKPYVGYVGDPMPFYDEASKTFRILYLHDMRSGNMNIYHPIYALETTDAADYTGLGEAVPCGSTSEDDPAIGTGSTVVAGGKYYTFYTGHKSASPREVILKAVSDDGIHWSKDRSFRMQAPSNYNQDEFRDPCVFRDDDAGLYRMVVSAIKDGTSVLAQFTSTDLVTWNEAEPFFHNKWGRFYECPDIFKMGDYWYLVYSDKDVTMQVQYFYARTLQELMNMGNDPAFPDSDEGKLEGANHSFYAGKTASNGTDRYIWGWCATREGNVSEATYEWAGALVSHKLVQNADGTLGMDCPDAVKAKFVKAVDATAVDKSGNAVQPVNGTYTLEAGTSLRFPRLNYTNKIEFDATVSAGASVFGLSFLDCSDRDETYRVYIEDRYNILKFDKTVTGEDGTESRTNINSLNFMHPEDGNYHVTVITDQSVCVVYINGRYAFTNRIYGMQRNPWALFCSDGNVQISNLSIATY